MIDKGTYLVCYIVEGRGQPVVAGDHIRYQYRTSELEEFMVETRRAIARFNNVPEDAITFAITNIIKTSEETPEEKEK